MPASSADAMLRAMLAVLRPGRLETEVAAWGAWVGRMLGSERDGFQIMVGANTANRTLIGPALNRQIHGGRLGSPRRCAETRWVNGLHSPFRHRRRLAHESHAEQKYWFDLVEEGYKVGERSYREVASKQLPARLQEQSLVDFFAGAFAGDLASYRPEDRPRAAEALHRHAQLRLYRMPGILWRDHARQPRTAGQSDCHHAGRGAARNRRSTGTTS